MKVEELMIGDWVMNGDKPSKIVRILPQTHPFGETEKPVEDLVHIVLNNVYKQVNVSDIEPIQLTEEILEKNGFKKNTNNNTLQLIVDNIHISYGFYKDCLSASDWCEDRNICQITSLKCKYVHQLQHALKLCGIDKTI